MKNFNKTKLFILFWSMISMVIFILYIARSQDNDRSYREIMKEGPIEKKANKVKGGSDSSPNNIAGYQINKCTENPF